MSNCSINSQKINKWTLSVHFSYSWPTLCNPMHCSMPGLLSITNSWSLLKLMSIESMMPSIQPSHPLSTPSPSALNLSQYWVFYNESALRIKWPKYWRFSISPSSEYSALISFRIDWFDRLTKNAYAVLTVC